jgi:hypothetical protein
VETKRSIHPEELQLNRSFASYDWLNGVLWDNESIPIELERKLHALVVDENDGSIILDRFLSEPQTRSRYGRRDEKENESNRKSSKNRFGNKSRVARIIFENKQNNAWPADKLVDEFYASELSAKQLARFHRPVWQFTKEERGKKMIIKLRNKNKNAEAFGKNDETMGSTNNAMRKSSDLSLRSGNFIMVEHMERFPMCLPNFGMVSRLVRSVRARSVRILIIFLEYQRTKILYHSRFALKHRYQEHLSHLKETDDDAPYIHGKFWYFCKTIEGQSYKIYCRRERLKEDDRLMKNETAGVYHFSY